MQPGQFQPPPYPQHLFTQSRYRIIAGLIALGLLALLIYSFYARGVQAAGVNFSKTHMYSSNFSTVNLPTDGKTQATLTTISFTVPKQGQVEVTSIFALTIFDPSNRPQGCEGRQPGTLNCSLTLDNASLTSLNDVYYSYNVVSQEYGMTTTSNVTAGSHTLALNCTGLLYSQYSFLVMQATGRGMSATVLF